MNGQMFHQAIGCIPDITSSLECDAVQTYIFLTRHLLEKKVRFHKMQKCPACELISCENILKHLGCWDLSVVWPWHASGATTGMLGKVLKHEVLSLKGSSMSCVLYERQCTEGAHVPASDSMHAKSCKQY